MLGMCRHVEQVTLITAYFRQKVDEGHDLLAPLIVEGSRTEEKFKRKVDFVISPVGATKTGCCLQTGTSSLRF